MQMHTNKTTTFGFSNHSDQQQQNWKYPCQIAVIIKMIMMADDADAGMLDTKNNLNQCIKINTDNSRIASP
jgi:hypothetical protein